MDALGTAYSRSYKWPFDSSHNGDVVRDEIECDTPALVEVALLVLFTLLRSSPAKK